MNNATNNGRHQRNKGGDPIRVLQGGNNEVVIVENSSSKEEEFYKEEVVVCRNRQDNHDYRVKVDIPLFYEMMGVKEFLIERSR